MFKKTYTVVVEPLDFKNKEKMQVVYVKALTENSAINKAKKIFKPNTGNIRDYHFKAYSGVQKDYWLEVLINDNKHLEINSTDFRKEILQIQKEVQEVLLIQLTQKLEGLAIEDSKKLLSSVMFHSYITLRILNFYVEEGSYADYSYIKTVSGMVSDMLHNAPHMMVNGYYPEQSEEFKLEAIKSIIIEYTLFMKALETELKTKDSYGYIKYKLQQYNAFDFDLDRYLAINN